MKQPPAGTLLALILLGCVSPTDRKVPLSNDLLAVDPEYGARDTYANYTALATRERINVDYLITFTDRRSPTTVLAIHGGKIEKGSSELAREVAGLDLNLYLFEGIKPNGNFGLHITSRNFDEPQALGMMARSEYGISMHGFTEAARPDAMILLVGGGSAALKAAFVQEARRSGLEIEIPVDENRFPGVEPGNIVNRSSKAGLQLEMSAPLRKRLVEDPIFRAILAKAVRTALNRTIAGIR